MDHLRALRLLGWFTVGFAFGWLALWIPYAHAYPATGSAGYLYRLDQQGPVACPIAATGYVYSSAAAAADAATPSKIADGYMGVCNWGGTATRTGLDLVSPTPPTYQPRWTVYNSTGGTMVTNAAIGPQVQSQAGTVYSCPNGGTLSGQTCTCPAGYTDTGTGCDATPVVCDYPKTRDAATNTCVCPTAGTTTIGTAPLLVERGLSSPVPSTICHSGCAMAPQWPSVVLWFEYEGHLGAYLDRQFSPYSGATCTASLEGNGSQDTSADPTDKRCAQGQVWGEVNGVGGCYPGKTQTEGQGSTTEEKVNPDGTKEVRTVTKFENTICTGAGACTTTITTTITTTYKDSNNVTTGTKTETSTETKPGDGTELGAFCAKNPKARICEGAGGDGTGDSFGGSCTAAFKCEGDAVTCAIALEQHKRNCEFWTPVGDASRKTDAETFFGKAMSGEGIGEDFIPKANNGQNIEAGTLNITERINAGSCPAPVAIATPLGSFTVDFQHLCPWFEFMGNIVLLACVLVAAKITIGGIV